MPVLRFEDFQDHVGSVFTIVEDGSPIANLTLHTADPLPLRSVPQGVRPPFALTFLAPEQRVLPQQIYALTHTEMGTLEIFLAPMARDAHGVTYHATFS